MYVRANTDFKPNQFGNGENIKLMQKKICKHLLIFGKQSKIVIHGIQ